MNFLLESNCRFIIKKVATAVTKATMIENKTHGSMVLEVTPLP